jgi:2'-5' RNA ligase
MQKYSYSTIQINLPDYLTKLVNYWILGYMDPAHLHPDEKNGSDIHITVQYGLTTNDDSLVRSVVQETGPFEITLGKVSLFEQEFMDVVKIEVESEGIHKLNKLITSNLEYITNYPNYVPHCTLAYTLKGFGQYYKDDVFFNGLSFMAKDAQFRSADQGIITKILL